MKIIEYPDGTSYVKVPDYGVNNEFVFKTNSYKDLWHLNQLVDAWNHCYNKMPTIKIPNLIDAQADRRFSDWESSGLKLVCNFLNNMKARFKIFHPHNPEVVEALINKVEIIDNSKFIIKVLHELNPDYIRFSKPFISDELILMSPDAGGFKSLMKLCDKIEWDGRTDSASKYRSYDVDTNKSSLIQKLDTQDFGSKDILIIDDICVYGGTFKGLAKLLKKRNCGKIYLAVSHMTIQNHKDSELFDLFDIVFTTNSKFDNYYVPSKNGNGGYQPENLKIIKMF